MAPAAVVAPAESASPSPLPVDVGDLLDDDEESDAEGASGVRGRGEAQAPAAATASVGASSSTTGTEKAGEGGHAEPRPQAKPAGTRTLLVGCVPLSWSRQDLLRAFQDRVEGAESAVVKRGPGQLVASGGSVTFSTPAAAEQAQEVMHGLPVDEDLALSVRSSPKLQLSEFHTHLHGLPARVRWEAVFSWAVAGLNAHTPGAGRQVLGVQGCGHRDGTVKLFFKSPLALRQAWKALPGRPFAGRPVQLTEDGGGKAPTTTTTSSGIVVTRRGRTSEQTGGSKRARAGTGNPRLAKLPRQH